ncbi:MAG: RNA degradosome polyphosphate kinase, partial [Clostridia bacterium]
NRKIIIGSADLMRRNLDNRYEIAYEVEDKAIKREIVKMLNVYLKDNVKARVCDCDGEYHFVELKDGERRFSCQNYFKNQARARNRKDK